MASSALGRILVIANPAAQSGAGERAAREAEGMLSSACPDGSWAIRRTEGAGHAVELARAAAGEGFSTVLALGGDGIVHEVANGLMGVGAASRPALGVVPIGSGNDFARTCGVARNRPSEALGQLLGGRLASHDVGLVNGVYYVETLSFGLDAAIALDTMRTRRSGGVHGTLLYAASGVDVFVRHRRTYAYEAELVLGDGSTETLSGEEIVFAVQVGPTYGGGFKVCPAADPSDGLLDVCRSVLSPSLPRTLALFFAARFGMHRGSRVVDFRKVRSLKVEFAEEPPAQADGEPMTGTRFEVVCVPSALRVVVPAR